MTADPDAALGSGPVLHRIEAACHGPLREVWTELDAELWDRVRAAVEAAVEGHAEASATLSHTCPKDPREAVAELRAYLTHVRREVHAPLHSALKDVSLPQAVQRLLTQAASRSRDAAQALAREVPLAFEAQALQRAPGDGWRRRLAKAVARTRGWVRRPPATRTADARGLARMHRCQRLAPGEHRWTVDIMRAWARWMADLESVWAAWAETVLAAATAAPPPDVDPGAPVEVEDGDEGETWPPWAGVSGAAAVLEAGLATLGSVCPHSIVAESAVRDLERWASVLEEDIGLAGTSVLRLDPAATEARPPGGVAAWSRWLDQGLGRVEFHGALLDVVLGSDAARRRAVERLSDSVLAPVRARAEETRERLHGLTSELSGAASLAAGLSATRTRAEEILGALATALRDRADVGAAVAASADAVVSDVAEAIRQLPETVALHGLGRAGDDLHRPTDIVRTVHLQEAGRQAFDALRMERLRTAPSALVTAAGGLNASVGEVGEIISYGFGAAVTEMEKEEEEAREQSAVLASEALERAASAAAHVSHPLAAALGRADRVLDEELTAGCRRLVDRALAHRMQGQLLDARSQLSSTLATWRGTLGSRAHRLFRLLRLFWARTRHAAQRLERTVRALVGAPAVSRGAAERTARRLADADTLRSELPLVYQRLFDPGPVNDPALLVGRDVELADVEVRLKRWDDEDEVPLVVTGLRGVGVTSFFNVLAERSRIAGRSVVHHELDERHSAESGLARELAEILGVEPTDSMDHLAATILRAPAGSMPEVVLLEGLEHLYLRVPGGTDLLERVLTFMAETEPRLFWIASLTSSALQVIEKTEPTAVSQVDRLALAPLGPDAMKAAVLARHRRSGVPLQYLEPAEGRRLLRRRLRRARAHEARQSILEADLFDSLHRTSHGHLRLTMFRWLRSCDFTAVEGELRIRPLEPLDFSYLDELDLTQNFTLKALLEHGTLTLDEHNEVFRLPRQESYQIFESLQNRRIIRPMSVGEDGTPRGSEVTDDLRYGIRPLLTGAVTAHLATRNIVH